MSDISSIIYVGVLVMHKKAAYMVKVYSKGTQVAEIFDVKSNKIVRPAGKVPPAVFTKAWRAASKAWK